MIVRLAAPALSLALFGYCGVLGYAALALFRRRRPIGQNLLVAPIVGFAIVLLPTFWLSWLGAPVERFAAPLGVALFVLAAIVLWRLRPVFPIRLAGRFALPLAAAMVLTGWPLATLGFSWLAYANDDMANYCLLAERLLHYGLVEAPPLTELARSTDLSLSFWFLEIGIARPGSQLLLAWLGAIVSRPLPELFMPVLLALHLALVASTGALVYRRAPYRAAALATCWLMAASALTTFGTMSQLIAQVFGLALGAALVAIAWEAWQPDRSRLASAGLLGALAAAFFLVYPEIAPFIAPAILWRIADVAYRTRRLSHLLSLAAASLVGLVLLAPYAGRIVSYVLEQARSGGGSANNDIFPYYIVPAGFASFWGLVPLTTSVPDPWMSATIAVGALLAVVACVWMLGVLRGGEAAAVVLLGMALAVPVLFFIRDSGFGLFKLAMYAQPFLLGTLTLPPLSAGGSSFAGSLAIRRRLARPHAMFLLILGLAGLWAQRAYVESAAHGGSSLEIGNHEELVRDFNEIGRQSATGLDVDLPDITVAKLLALYARGVPMWVINEEIRPGPPDPRMVPSGSPRQAVEGARAVVDRVKEPREFAMHDPASPDRDNAFAVWTGPRVSTEPQATNGGHARCQTLVAETASQTVLNRFRPIDDAGNALTMLPCGTVANHLVFVSSALGRHYYLDYLRDGVLGRIGLFGLEVDYFVPGQSMAGIGRYLLFEVINPTPRLRVLLDVSASMKSDGSNLLPPAHAIGTTRVPVGLIGRGSARVYSPPLEPQVINGRSYIALDLGVEGTRYPQRRSGLMALFGRHISLDPRAIVLLARNISAVSEEEYTSLVPPHRLAEFPRGLSDPTLQYSGLYEDGWVAESAAVRLTRPAEAAWLVVRGHAYEPLDPRSPLTAEIGFGSETIARQTLSSGPFEIRVPVDARDVGIVEISLRLSSARPLSSGDTRPMAATVRFIGFE